MSRRFLLLLALLTLSFALLLPVSAQEPVAPPDPPVPAPQAAAPLVLSPDTLTYQGLLEVGGMPAIGSYDFEFRLFDSASGGVQVGTTTTVVSQTLESGVFTVQLNFGEPVFTGAQRWLDISVRADSDTVYTPLTPRQAVTGAPLALALPGLWTQQNAASPNIIGGYEGNSVNLGAAGQTIAGGGQASLENRTTAEFATVSGGMSNSAGGPYAAIGGGSENLANGLYAAVGGGRLNDAPALYATVGGGTQNQAAASQSAVGGGFDNAVYDVAGVVSGGNGNLAGSDDGNPLNALAATVGGGGSNVAGASNATVSGGFDNSANGADATVGGGTGNVASGSASMVGGGSTNEAAGMYAAISGGHENDADGESAFVGGGWENAVTADYGTIGGGLRNRVTDYVGVVAGGDNNQAGSADGNPLNAVRATVGGGSFNDANAHYATIGGGYDNTAAGPYATVCGGNMNIAAGTEAFACGGAMNRAEGEGAVALGGKGNSASGTAAFAAGQGAVAAHDGAFVWAGAQETERETITSTAPNQFVVRAPGGIWLGSGNRVAMPEGAFLATDNGAYLTTGGSWANASDAALKSGFATVDSTRLLEAVARLPVQSWSYLSEGAQVRHLGPTAQDFRAAFGLGSDDTHIATVDADGVALAAIQGLHTQNREQAAEIDALRNRLTTLEQGVPSASLLPWLGMALMAGILGGWWLRDRLRARAGVDGGQGAGVTRSAEA